MKRVLGFLFGVLATFWMASPALAWEQNDSVQPGSVLVFPKFIKGSVQDLDTEHTGVLPRTVFKISVVCPNGIADCSTVGTVTLKAHWVCPGRVASVCAETNFFLTTTVWGTILFSPNPELNDEDSGGYLNDNDLHRGPSPGGISPPPTGCNEGYLIVWVVDDMINGNAIKFDGLIGSAVLRSDLGSINISNASTQSASLGNSTRSYNAIPIQAADELFASAPPFNIVSSNGSPLVFDGSPTGYKSVTGTVYAPLRYADDTGEDTRVVLLTLNVNSNQVNPQTDVGLNFYAQDQTPYSDAAHFFCWGEFELRGKGKTEDVIGSEYGLLQSTSALQGSSSVSLLGLVETRESATQTVSIANLASANATIRKDFAYLMFNNGQPVCTTFAPLP